jgi:protocatechuate 3,4-dioxygenase beta subunit
MRRWLGVGVALALLAVALWYASGSNLEGRSSDPTAQETGRNESGRASIRRLPVNALLSAPLPAPRGSLHIRGTVVGPAGEPVPGAVVVATAPTPDETLSELPCQCDNHCGQKLLQCGCGMAAIQLVELVAERRGEAPPLARTTSDAQGHFSLEGLEAGRYALWADGSLGTALQQNVETGTEDVELRMGQGMTLSGHLTDEDGQPVAGALVTALFVEHSRFFDTLSDAEGRWRLGPLPDGDYNLVFAREGFLPEHAKVRQDSDHEQEVTLHRPRRLTGRVLWEEQPVSGARVHAEGEHRELDTTTDAQGHFSFEGLRPGKYEVDASHAGLDATGQAELQPGVDASELLLELGAGVRVTGTVRDTAGRPIADAEVSALLSSPEYRRREKKTRTASDGTYALGPFESARYRFQAEASRYVGPESQTKLLKENLTLDFVLQDAIMVEGRVVGANGEPLEGVTLTLTDTSNAEIDEEVDNGSSEKDGTFALQALKPGSYALQAVHEDFIPATRTVLAPSSGVQVVLSAGAQVVGDVVDETGAPVPEAEVSLVPEQEAEAPRAKQTLPNEQGHFTIEGVAAGRYVISARLGMRKTSRPIEVRATGTVQVRLQFRAGSRLAGIVVDRTGKPVPEARVVARASEVEETEHAWVREGGITSPVTEADGHFEFQHLAPGRYMVAVFKDGYLFDAMASGGTAPDDERDEPTLEVSAGNTQMRLVLEQLSTIHGRVVRSDGTPVTRFELNGTELKDPRGAFTHPIGESGQVTLTFKAPGLAGTSRELKVKKGVDTDLGEVVLDAGRTIRGKVVDVATGAPLSGAVVNVSDEPADSGSRIYVSERRGAVRTRGDGTFTLPNVEERSLTLVAAHPEYMQKQMVLAPQQTEMTVALDMGATLRGTVRTGDKGASSVLIQSLDVSFQRVVALSGGAYEAPGLHAGSYVVRVLGLEREEEHTLHPQRVQLPARGVVTLDLEEARTGTTLRLRVASETRQSQDVILIAGRHPAPNSLEELLRMGGTSYPPYRERERDLYVFRLLPAGTYTLLLLRSTGKDAELHHEELELPAQGEVSRDVTPRWERRSARQFLGTHTEE